MVDYRKADSKDLSQLNKIAYESEAYWGYDETFMSIFKEKYALDEELLKQSETFVMRDDEKIIGFFSIIRVGEVNSTIDPNLKIPAFKFQLK